MADVRRLSPVPALRTFLLLVVSAAAVAGDVTVRIQPPDGGEPRTFYAETATTAVARQRGLSGREFLPPDRGMLFEFTPPRRGGCMWMKDTHMPLAALFVDNNNTIFTIALMQPRSTVPHCARRPVKYVFEIAGKIGEEIETGSKLVIME